MYQARIKLMELHTGKLEKKINHNKENQVSFEILLQDLENYKEMAEKQKAMATYYAPLIADDELKDELMGEATHTLTKGQGVLDVRKSIKKI